VARAKRYPADLVRVIQRNESDQGWRIRRRRVLCFGDPIPLVPHVGPAAIVIWRIAPWLTGNPGWPIGIIVGPLTLLIRDPAGVNSRSPGIAVTINVLPVAVVVEIVQTRNAGVSILVT